MLRVSQIALLRVWKPGISRFDDVVVMMVVVVVYSFTPIYSVPATIVPDEHSENANKYSPLAEVNQLQFWPKAHGETHTTVSLTYVNCVEPP